MTIELPLEKKVNLTNQIHIMEKKNTCSIREFAQFIGSVVASCPAVEYGMIHTKFLEKAKLEALEIGSGNFDTKMNIPEFIKDDLKWWKENLKSFCKKIRSFQFKREIFSDASKTGWGAFCNGNKAHGQWSPDQSRLHINQLELKAAFLAIKCFASDLSNCEVFLRIDNTTAMTYINKMGGVRVDYLHAEAKKFWEWCETKNLWVFAEYISSRDNVEADTLSRIVNIDTEWQLADYAFHRITRVFGAPEIDLFASRLNTKCPTYCSWEIDPDALVINAFTITWTNLKFYAFPPFCLIIKVLRKIKNDKASGILVAPLWTGQPWFPIFMEMIEESYLIFQPNNNLLISPYSTNHHPRAFNLTLVAARLSGKRSGGKVRQITQST